MTLETANPVIVAMILLPFVVICLLLIAGWLSHWYKHREYDHCPVNEDCSEDYQDCGDQCSEDWLTGDDEQ